MRPLFSVVFRSGDWPVQDKVPDTSQYLAFGEDKKN